MPEPTLGAVLRTLQVFVKGGHLVRQLVCTIPAPCVHMDTALAGYLFAQIRQQQVTQSCLSLLLCPETMAIQT